ncbi:hypothetical protein K9U40_00820 [Xanthobacter autotrophicus]|uniref:hypothetical protein n=1 Tax=Xanthobacter TaxID=279 RepID=UPI0024AA1695|nr:hypothetical protein [Xanthobacter autotrophicus]MDI4662886.1 hypothetical protein [Xanthobacter autotrophicus]
MAALFYVLAGLALLAAILAWGVAVRGGLKAIAANRAAGQGGGAGSYALLALWPFAVRRRGREADADAVRTGKAAIAFFVSVTVAVAAISAYTNLTYKPPVAPAGSSPAGATGAPSKS